MTKIYVFGDSHVSPVSWGYSPSKNALPPQFRFDFYARHGGNWIYPAIRETQDGLHFFSDAVKNEKPVDYAVTDRQGLYAFSSVLHSPPFFRHAAWQTFCPWTCADMNPDLQPVSNAVVETWAARHLQGPFRIITQMKEAGFHTVVLEPPKPLTRTPAMWNVRRDVLRAVDQVFREFVFRWLAEHQIPVICAPESTQEDGFTAPKFESSNMKDPHHGNALFGEMLIQAIVAFATAHTPLEVALPSSAVPVAD